MQGVSGSGNSHTVRPLQHKTGISPAKDVFNLQEIRLMTRFGLHISTLVLVALLMVFSAAANAQDTTGSISGTVTDQSGASVKGASVTLTNTDRGQDVRTLVTNSGGFFTATSLPLGTYTVKVAASGFKAEAVTGLVLHVNDALTVNRTLVPGNVTETVSVAANQVQLNLEDATAAGLITGNQMKELVLNSRNYEQLIQLQPGVAFSGATDQLYVGATVPGGTSAAVAFSVNGGRTTSNNWTVDGADNVDRGANLTLLVFPSVDAITEFKTLRGQYSAEFGRSASGQINVVTRSGTNGFHGTAYEFFRNDVLNANTWLDKNVSSPSLFTARPKLRYNDFGGTFGGPVLIPHLYDGRDKTFFFFSYEGRRVNQYVTGNALVPTADERAGNFSNEYYLPTGAPANGWQQGPVNVCTAYNPSNGVCTATGNKISSIDSVAAAYIKDVYANVPLPNSAAEIAAGLDPHTITSTAANSFKDDQTLARVDQAIGKKLNVFYRFIHDTFPVYSGTGTFSTVPIGGIASTYTTQPGTTHLGHGTYVFNPTLLVDMGYAYSSGQIVTTPLGALTNTGSPDIKPSLPFVNTLGVVPVLGINGLTTLGSSGIYHDYNINHEAYGSVTKTWRLHTFITGITYNHYQKKENLTAGGTGNQGNYAFTTNSTIVAPTGVSSSSLTIPYSYANFLIGNVNNGFSQLSQAITPSIEQNLYEGFFQDNWRIIPRLTLNLGVRYSYFQAPFDGNGQLSNFDPTLYSASKAPTINSKGQICLAAPCANTDGLNTGLPNANADYTGVNYINGMTFGSKTAPNGQSSPYGSSVGSVPKDNFAPRIGFAYDVFGDGRTSFRGGYGWSFDEAEVSYWESAVFFNPPYVTTFSATTAVMDSPAGTGGTPTTPSVTPGRLYAVPTHYRTPYNQQYSLDVQQAITSTLMLDVGYFGEHGTNLLGLVELNEPTPGSYVNPNGTLKVNPAVGIGSSCVYPGTTTPAFINTTCDAALNQIKPYLGYFSIGATRNWFSSNYNSLQVKVTKRFSGKSMIDANYTWSRDLTNSQNDYSTPPQNTYNINADYGRAAVDRTNIIAIDGIYELPWFREQKGFVGHVVGGWEVSGIYAIDSGLPLTASASTGSQVYYGYTNPLNGKTAGNYVSDAAGLGISGNSPAGFRPDQIGNPRNGYGQPLHTKLQWFYRGAFDTPLPTDVRPGNEKRGVIEGPGFNRLDVGLFRNFKIWENCSFQLRGEAFNTLNHTNYQGINTTATSTAFGQITSARDNRILQVAGKITF
jgi:hypothetical protein